MTQEQTNYRKVVPTMSEFRDRWEILSPSKPNNPSNTQDAMAGHHHSAHDVEFERQCGGCENEWRDERYAELRKEGKTPEQAYFQTLDEWVNL